MQVTRQHVVDILRTARLRELAEEAHRVLPDPVEYNDAARFDPLPPFGAMLLAGFRGAEAEAAPLIEAVSTAAQAAG
jgi:hypothetical protein